MTTTNRRFTLVCLAVFTSASVFPIFRAAHGEVGAAAPDDAFRIVPMTKEAGEYSELQRAMIHAKDDVGRLTAGGNEVTRGIRVALRKMIEAAIDDADLDFSKECLVLLTHREGSGSTEVTFHPPVLERETLKCRITTFTPEDEDLNADEANYCFAVAVKRSIVRKVELYVGDRKTISLHVAAMPPIEPVTLRQLDAALLIGGQRTLQQKFFSVKSDDYRAVCAGRSRERPEAIRSEESLAAAFENDAVRKRVAEKVDFDREQLILFAWNGNSGDRMSAAVDNISDAPKVMFYELPRTGDGFVARSYIFLYVIDKDTKWEVGPAPESDD